ncbi:MAG: GNAT family N-acetyltransferase [Acidimicrobiia bacterium]|nr:GNAT family N-acetyltransferase [Acidimicrobiia bacterium]
MNVSARVATTGDLPELLRMYRLLEAEMIPLEPIWPNTDGLPEPATESLGGFIAHEDSTVLIGEIDGVPFGFLIGVRQGLIGQTGGHQVGSVRYVFTEADAREVGIGEAIIAAFLEAARADGISLFDAHVTPGHRLTKNFFESKGFSARSIVMHHDDRDDG